MYANDRVSLGYIQFVMNTRRRVGGTSPFTAMFMRKANISDRIHEVGVPEYKQEEEKEVSRLLCWFGFHKVPYYVVIDKSCEGHCVRCWTKIVRYPGGG